MGSPTTSKTQNIHGRVFTDADIVRLARTVEESIPHHRASRETPGYVLEIILRCQNGVTLTHDSVSQLLKAGHLDIHKPNSIEINFRNLQERQRIYVLLIHGDIQWLSNYRVESDNEDWTYGVSARLDHIISSVAAQSGWGYNFRLPVTTAVSLLPTVGLVFYEQQHAVNIVTSWLFAGIAMVVGSTVSISMIFFLRRLWPEVEIQVGPKHLYRETRIRKAVGAFMVYGPLAIAMSIIAAIVVLHFSK